MSQSIILPTEFDPSTVVFSSMKKNLHNAGKTVYINLENSKRLMMQLPTMKAPFGLSSFTDEASGKTTYNIPLSLDINNDNTNGMKDKLDQLDEMVVKAVENNSKEWLGKKYNMAVIKEALYKPVVKPARDEKYSPTVTVKVLCAGDGKFVPKFYNEARDEVDPNQIEKQQELVCIVSIPSIWFVDNKCGVTMRLEQCLMKKSNKLEPFAFRNQDEGVEDDEEELIDEDY